MNFTHLDVKSHYSFMNSLLKVEDIIAHAMSSNFNSVALCDVNNTFGLLELYYKSGNLKPLLGVELRFANDSYILYAKNYQGLRSIYKLSTYAASKELTHEIFFDEAKEVICIVNENSLVYKEYLLGKNEQINYLKRKFEQIFFISDYREVDLLEFPKSNKLIPLFGNTVKYLSKSDKKFLDLLHAINNNTKYLKVVADSKHHFMDVDDISKTFLYNTEVLIDMCNVEIPNDILIPKFCENSYEYLQKLCMLGLKKRLGNSERDINKYIERLKHELNVIKEMNFSDYFLIVFDYVKYAKSVGIYVGPGRGSAAGSLVSYSLGITNIDPIEYNLLFERFLNPMRKSYPDIDIDFEDTRRDEVVEYVKQKYGIEYVGLISTFSTFASKQVIRDVAKALGRNNVDIKKITDTINSTKSLKDNYRNNSKFRYIVDKSTENEMLYKYSLKLEGIIRHTSTHAAGLVISNQPLNSVIGTVPNSGYNLVQASMDYLENIGLIKMDLLGLRNLKIIKNVAENIEKQYHKKIDLDNIYLDDEKILQLFCEGKTSGLFQFESLGMRNVLSKVKPTKFLDIVACNALHRPGPMDNIDEFVLRKTQGNYKIIHDDLKEILEETYGIIVYQEQILEVARIICGYSYGEADVIRRAMSKKEFEKLKAVEDGFIKSGVNNGYDYNIVSEIFEYILKFANYGFNKSHAVCYSYIGYVMGYLKVHYPHYFMCELMNNSINNSVKIFEYINECRLMGIEVKGIDVNTSRDVFYVSENKIVMPFTLIKGLSSSIAQEIYQEAIVEKYSSLYNFIYRLMHKGITENNVSALIYVNAFKNIENLTISTQISSINDIIKGVEIHKYFNTEFLYQEQDEFEMHHLIFKERELLGFNFSNHPTSLYPKFLEINSMNIKTYLNQKVKMMLYIEKVKEHVTKNGETMAFITCSDMYGEIDVVAFNSVYDSKYIHKGVLMYAYSRVEVRNKKIQLNLISYKVKE